MRGQRLVQGRCNGEVVCQARTAAVCANGSINHHYSTEPPLVDVAERRLLAAVIHSSDHVLRPLFPPVITRRPGLRRRQHGFCPSGERRSQFYSSNSISYFKSLVHLLCQMFIFIIFIYQLTVPYLLRINSLFSIMFSGVAELWSVDRCPFCIH